MSKTIISAIYSGRGKLFKKGELCFFEVEKSTANFPVKLKEFRGTRYISYTSAENFFKDWKYLDVFMQNV